MLLKNKITRERSMPLMRWLNIVLFSFFLAACGGGGSLEKEGGSLDSGDGGTIDEPIYTLSAQGYVKESDETSNAVTETDPIDIKVTLLKNDEPVDGQRITFTLADDIGAVNVNSALTNSEGIAIVELSAGTQAGAGEITATFTGSDGDIDVTERFAFTSSGGQGESNQGTLYTLSAQGYVKESNATSNAVTETDPIDIKVTLLKNDEPVDGQRITFTLADDIGAVNVNSALTNSEGIAIVELSAGTQAGAGEITATFTGSDGDIDVTERFAFTSSGGQGESNQGIFTLSLKGLSQLDAEPTNTVTTLNSLDLQATLLQQGEPLHGKIIIN